MDDLKTSHKNVDTANTLINKLSEQYGNEADLTIHRGKVRQYLRMKLEDLEQGKVKTDMTDYLKKILYDLPDKYQGRAIKPAANHLFEVNETVHKLSEKYAQKSHIIVAKILFLCKQARPDILNGVALLTTRVRETNKDNGNKLSRILKISVVRGILYSPWNPTAPKWKNGGWTRYPRCTMA